MTHEQKKVRKKRFHPLRELRGAVEFVQHGCLPLLLLGSTAVVAAIAGLSVLVPPQYEPYALYGPLVLIGLIVGTLAHQVILDGTLGIEEPPKFSDVIEPLRTAGRFARDLGLTALVFAGPGALLAHAGWHAPALLLFLPLVAAGAMSFGLSQVRGDLGGLRPSVLFPAMRSVGRKGVLMSALAAAMFAPLLLTVGLTADSWSNLHLTIAVPLAALGMLMSARLIGRFFHVRVLTLQHHLDTRFCEISLRAQAHRVSRVEVYKSSRRSGVKRHRGAVMADETPRPVSTR